MDEEGEVMDEEGEVSDEEGGGREVVIWGGGGGFPRIPTVCSPRRGD